MSNVKIEASWKSVLAPEFEREYWKKLTNFIHEEIKAGYEIYPPGNQIFAAFNLCPFDTVKVVILGQDPYHGHGQCHGPCFSVNPNIPIPPSLKNIFKELKLEFPDFQIPKSGDIRSWCKQGVLMINATLTVRAHQPMSHAGQGWEEFTNATIRKISEEKEGVIFLLWGRHARAKKDLINGKKHLILEAAHPSPFSASNGFFGCDHFRLTNERLEKLGKEQIDWQT